MLSRRPFPATFRIPGQPERNAGAHCPPLFFFLIGASSLDPGGDLCPLVREQPMEWPKSGRFRRRFSFSHTRPSFEFGGLPFPGGKRGAFPPAATGGRVFLFYLLMITPAALPGDGETDANSPAPYRREWIAALNDAFRKTFRGGKVLLTAGISALPPEEQEAVLTQVRTFADFTEENNPWGEHDFGSIRHNGLRIFWKIDYYDRSMEGGSPEPADPDKTTRVLTVMLAEEYWFRPGKGRSELKEIREEMGTTVSSPFLGSFGSGNRSCHSGIKHRWSPPVCQAFNR
jgi:hypothetical protein